MIPGVWFEGCDGIQLAADVWGDDAAWPVLFLHGAGQTRHAWGESAERIAADGWRTITVDLRGHGESDWAPDGDYSHAAFGADCLRLARQVGRPPVLVGASLGGVAAMLAEGTAEGELASGLVLVDIAANANRDGADRVHQFMRSGLEGFTSPDEAAAAIASYLPHREGGRSVSGLGRVLREREGRWYWHWDPAFMSRSRVVEYESRPGELRGVAIRPITVPVALVRGQLSDVVTKSEVDDLIERMPNAVVVEVPGAAHMVAGDQNDAFTRAVLDFLDDYVRPTLA